MIGLWSDERLARPRAAWQAGGDARPSTSRRRFRLGDRLEEMKEAFDARDFESLMDTLIHAHQAKAASIFLSSDIGPHQRTNPRGIRQGNIREVQNERARVVGTHLGLEAEHIGKRQRPGKTQDADSLPRPGKIFDVQRLLRHVKNVNGE